MVNYDWICGVQLDTSSVSLIENIGFFSNLLSYKEVNLAKVALLK